MPNIFQSLSPSLQSTQVSSEANSSRIPPPQYRHAAPSAPWPWVDLRDDINLEQFNSKVDPIPPKCDHKSEGCCWKGYPTSRFPNWTAHQVRRSGIGAAVKRSRNGRERKCHRIDIDTDGRFHHVDDLVFKNGDDNENWRKIVNTKRPDNLRVRMLFVREMSGPVVQMLGAYFNIEPFFFSASLNWIPSRFQEEIQDREGDHITVTLPFIRPVLVEPKSLEPGSYPLKRSVPLHSQNIDTQAPLYLESNNTKLVPDLLSVHLIRNVNGSTIISYCSSDSNTDTQAQDLHGKIRLAGHSVYWQSIFQKSPDPTFVLLVFLWHAMYAWDESIEYLYGHICSLEDQVIDTSETILTRELHVIRAQTLHYNSLLENFKNSVLFIRNTPNPAMDSQHDAKFKEWSKNLLERECNNLLGEVERLVMALRMIDERLRNVMNLVFSTVNIQDSRYMRKMTEAAVRDSAAMKQIAYLTMIFLPASFVAGVFGMNIKELTNSTSGTLAHYFAAAVPLTVATAWIIIAFQSTYFFKDKLSFWKRLGWPVFLIKKRYFGKDTNLKSEDRLNITNTVHMV